MNALILRLIAGEAISDADIDDALYEICEREHSSCNNDCPVYCLLCLLPRRHDLVNGVCPCFKNGTEMRKFIKSQIGVVLKK
jgi:hypothetical protein